jgi:Transglutaminase-like superfamily
MRKIRRAASLTLSDWRYLTIASGELLVARIRLSTVAAEKILRELQAPLSAVQQRTTLAEIDVERLSWAIAVAAQFVPWRSDCFVRVIAADRWLRRYHLRPDFYLGVAKDEQGVFTAHAWVRYGDLTVTGGSYDQFSPLIEPAAK